MPDNDKPSGPEVTTDSHIIKMKSLGLSDKKIAAKFGMTEEEVQRRLREMTERVELSSLSGAAELIQMTRLAVHQYQMLGSTLGMLATENNNLAEPIDLRGVLCQEDIPDHIIENLVRSLTKNFIILKPFIIPDVKKTIEDAQKIIGN